MVKLNLTGYVNNVRVNTLSSGKKVTNIKLGVPVSKVNDKQVYQSFEIAFWENLADAAAQVKEKDYIHCPDVILNKFEITQGKDGKSYMNISGNGSVVFKGLPKVEIKEEVVDTDNNPF